MPRTHSRAVCAAICAGGLGVLLLLLVGSTQASGRPPDGGGAVTIRIGHRPDAVAVDARIARVFVANRSAGTVRVLDAHDGTLRRTVAVGGQPSTLAVDQRRGRVYVMNAESGTLSVLDAVRERLLRTLRVAPGPVWATRSATPWPWTNGASGST